MAGAALSLSGTCWRALGAPFAWQAQHFVHLKLLLRGSTFEAQRDAVMFKICFATCLCCKTFVIPVFSAGSSSRACEWYVTVLIFVCLVCSSNTVLDVNEPVLGSM